MLTETSVVGEIVAKNINTALVFESFGIDYCCRGNRTISEVCAEKSLEVKPLLDKLNPMVSNAGNGVDEKDFNTWPLGRLADYIQNTHHAFVRTEIPLLRQRVEKICSVHGSRHPELLEVKDLFIQSSLELLHHMTKEDTMLFPHIKELEQAALNNTPLKDSGFGSVANPIEMMMEEHTNEGDRFFKIADLTNNYTPPADACNTYRITFQTLKHFEKDLHRHIHLENNILFPKAIKLEKTLGAPFT